MLTLTAQLSRQGQEGQGPIEDMTLVPQVRKVRAALTTTDSSLLCCRATLVPFLYMLRFMGCGGGHGLHFSDTQLWRLFSYGSIPVKLTSHLCSS